MVDCRQAGSLRTTKRTAEPFSLPQICAFICRLLSIPCLSPKVSGVLSPLMLPFPVTVSPAEVTSRLPVTQSYCKQLQLFQLWLAVTLIHPDAGDTGSDPRRWSVPHLVGRSREKGRESLSPCICSQLHHVWHLAGWEPRTQNSLPPCSVPGMG